MLSSIVFDNRGRGRERCLERNDFNSTGINCTGDDFLITRGVVNTRTPFIPAQAGMEIQNQYTSAYKRQAVSYEQVTGTCGIGVYTSC